VIGQVGEDGEINAVFSKTLCILGHAKRFEPVPDLLHAVPSPAPLDGQHAEFNPPVASLKGSFLEGSMFLPGLLAITDEVTEFNLSRCGN
jgi:hypothetical protein